MNKKATISSIFLAPILGNDRTTLEKYGFINAYIKDSKKEVDYEEALFLLFKPPKMDQFNVFLEDQYEKNTILEDYDYDGGYVVVVYLLDPTYKKDYQLIKQGKYSKTSKAFQNLFPAQKEVKGKLLETLQWRVFNKVDSIKKHWEEKINVDFPNDWELWDKWEEDKEILDIDKL